MFWKATWDHALTSPWVGHGADNYLYIQPAPYGNQPHNVLLQWFLEYGVIGTIPLVGLVLLGTTSRRSLARSPDQKQWSLQTWSQASLAGSFVYGLFDGVFYHLIVFMPVAVIAGVAFGQRTNSPTGVVSPWLRRTRGILLGMAFTVLLLHNWLGFMLLRGTNVEPNSLAAHVIRQFPSTTHGLSNWLDRWRLTHPLVEWEWIQWAQTAALNAGSYHVRAAQLHLWRKNYKAAEAELILCLEKVHPDEREDVLEVLSRVRRRIGEATAIAPIPDDESR
jgi:hypothetical protein